MSLEVVALLVLAVVLFIAEAHLSSGVLGLLGVGSLVAAGFVYRDQGHSLPVAVIVVVALVAGGLVILVARKVLAAQRDERVRTGYEELTGAIAEVRSTIDPEGQVFVQGSLWRARAGEGEDPIPVGGRVRIESVDGLTLIVRSATEEGARR